MKDNIFCICLGNNCGNLHGSKNDSILFFNYIHSLSENNNLKENWLKPSILFDSNVAVDNIKELISKNNFNKLIIYYSGHGYSNGNLNIYNSSRGIITDRRLISEISDAVKNEIELYIILDSCYSGCTNTIPYQKVKKINIITSSTCNQTSAESIASIENVVDKIKYNFSDLTIKKRNITVGVFTYNLVEQLYQDKINQISKFPDVFKNNENAWKTIRLIGKQNPKIIWK